MSTVTRDLERLAELHPGERPDQHVDTAVIPLKSRLELVEGLLRDAIGAPERLDDARLQAMADNLADVREGMEEAVQYLLRAHAERDKVAS